MSSNEPNTRLSSDLMGASVRPCVFIQANAQQHLGALVARYSLVRNSEHADLFDVRILHSDDFPFLRERHGQRFLRYGKAHTWLYDDLQSFTPLRFAVPEQMAYQGRAIVIDPDVFALGDIWDLLSRDMEGKPVWCRERDDSARHGWAMATSVMLLDCARLRHWRCEEQFTRTFEFTLDFGDWICLRTEPREQIGLFEDEWNDFDRLTARTKLLHNTERSTQPWKTGLPVDYKLGRPRPRVKPLRPRTWLRAVGSRGNGTPRYYLPHPDPAQERRFFGLLRECLSQGVVTESMLREEMRRNHLRHDALEVLERTSDSGLRPPEPM
jgi:hypothetical protein